MAFNRELSQFANYLELDAGANYIGIATNTNDANVGIGSATPESKLTVTGDAKISGVVTATSFDGALVGNADSASVLETARTISLSGDLGGSVSFDGSQDITITATVQPDSVDLGTDTVGNYVRELQAVGGSGIAVIDGTGEGTLAQVELTDTGVAPGTTGSSTEIPVITVDSKGRITSVSTTDVGTTLTVEGDSGTAAIDLLTETIKFAGGANITSTVAPGSGGTVTYQSNATEFGSAAAGLGTRVFTAGQSDTIFDGADGGFSFDPLYITEGQDLRLKFGAVNNPNYNLRVRLNKDDTLLHSSNFSNFNNLDLTTAIPSERYPLALTDIEIIALSDASSASVVVIEISIDGSVISNGSTVSVPATSDVVSYALDSDISLNTVTATEFNTGAQGSAIRVSTDTISGPATLTLDPAGVGDNTGKVVIAGDLQVDGTQTIVNSTTITVDDKNISLADGATNDAEADGGGITIQSGEGDKTFQFEANGDNFGSSENMNLADGKTYKINNVDILSQTALGDSVVESSLTSVGNLEQLNVLGIVTASTFVATSGTFDLTGNVTGNLDGIAENASGILTARDFTISGDATAPAVSFDGRQNVDLNLTLADTGVVSSAYGSSVKIPRIVVDSKGRITGVTELTGDLLEKAGGTMSGDIVMGEAVGSGWNQTQTWDNNAVTTGNGGNWTNLQNLFSGNLGTYAHPNIDGSGVSVTLTFDPPLPTTTGVKVWGGIQNPNCTWRVNSEASIAFNSDNYNSVENSYAFVGDVSSITIECDPNDTNGGLYLYGVSVNDQLLVDPSIVDPLAGQGSNATIGVDGTASFSGLITAATAPTADEHLTNKAYVDGLDSANSADIAANAAAIAAETAARVAADTTLTTNLAAEEAARIAADATKLPLAGGLMTGAIEFGTAPPPPGGSVAFDASDSRVTTIVEDSNRLTTMNFTTEVFIRVDALPEPGEQFMIYSQPNFGFNIKNDGGQMKISYGMSGLGFGSSGSAGFGFTIVPGTWHHYAIVRNGADVKLFFDGEQALSLAAMSGRPLTINNGDTITLGGGTNGFSGIHYSNARIVVDESIYTNTFTPPTAEFAVSDYAGTGLLAFQSSTSADEEATGKTLTLTNVNVSSDNPGLTSSGSGGALSTIAVDGTATFGGLVSATTAPTADEHLTNKAYVDAKAQTNADAITALVGGAPELLNTLDELAQALSDDEAFATTVTNQIAAETTARTAADTAEQTARISADNTLQANIDAEEAARIAADDTKLALAGGTMTGAIQLGATANNSFTFTRQASGEKNVHVSFANSGYNNTIQIHSPLSTGSNGKLAISGSNNGLQYGSIVATHDGEVTTVTTQYQHIQITSLADDYTNDTLTITLMPGGHYETADFSTRTHVYADMTQYFHEPVLRTGTISSVSVPTSVLGVDGTATFGGNISASTAPTADAHLTNKLYVDGLTSANTAAITTNATNIAANTAAISAEEAARIAADALKLDLAGGQMSGDLEVGQGTGPNPSINVISAIGSVSDLTVSGASGGWTTAAASLAKTMANGGKHYFEVFLEANATGGWIGVTGEASDADIDISGPSDSYVEAVPFHDNTTHTKHLVSGSLYDGGSSTANGVSAGAGDVLGVLVDASGDAPWTIGYTVNGVDAGSESIDYPWSDTYRPVLSIGAGDVTFRFNETDIEYLPTGYSAWVPTAPSVNLKTDGTASFAGNVTAALAPSSGDHLVNKTYVDSSVSTANTNLTAAIAAEEAARIAADTTEANARIAADTTLTNDLAAEQSARIAADATKLPLAGGTMTGDLELGSGGGASSTVALSGNGTYMIDFGPDFQNNFIDFTGTTGDDNDLYYISGNVTLDFSTTYGTSPGQYMFQWDSRPQAMLDNARYMIFINPGAANRGAPVMSHRSGADVTVYEFPFDYKGGGIANFDIADAVATTILSAPVGPQTTISVDGSATFGGNVTAATAPTSGDHLTNKTYVDAKAQANADAIEAVVGGAPELLNTLNELAQAISDDEAFATTVTNQIAAETTARQASDVTLQTNIDTEAATRLANDNTLQANIDAEEAARIAADATKLPLAGGTMSGAIQMGSSAYVPNAVRYGPEATLGSTSPEGVFFTDHFAADSRLTSRTNGNGVSFTPITVNSTLRIYAEMESGELLLNQSVSTGFSGSNIGAEWREITLASTPFVLTDVGFHNGSSGQSYSIYAIEVDGVIIDTAGGAGTIIGVDGTATFGGNVTAALAPSSGDHLANKTYVDGEVTSANTALTAAIAAEEAARIAADTTETNARIAADNVLTTNLANEVTNRQAGDALKLDLAGGNMSGDIEMGQAAGLVDYDTTSITSGVDQYNQPVAPTNLPKFFDGGDSNGFSIFPGQTLTFDPLVAQTSVRLLAYSPTNKRPVTVELNGVAVHTYQDDGQHSGYSVDLSSSLTFPYTLTSVGTAAGSKELVVYGVEIDGVNVGPGYQTTSAGPASTIGVDGSATFSGLISAATAPTSGSHLTNKTYVDASSSTLQASIDAEAATRLANDNTLQANIDAEEAARIAADSAEATARADADTVLTNDLATETAARIAADATKLPLAGGTMTGDLVVGQTATPAYVSNAVHYGSAGQIYQGTADGAFKPGGFAEDVFWYSRPDGNGFEFSPITVNSSLVISGGAQTGELTLNKTIFTGVGSPYPAAAHDVSSSIPSFPFTLTSIGFHNGFGGDGASIEWIEVDGVRILDPATTGACDFDGNDHLEMPDSSDFDLGLNGEAFTIESFVYPDHTNFGVIFNRGGGVAGWNGTDGHQISLYSYENRLYFEWWSGSAYSHIKTDPGAGLVAGSWQHLAVAYSGGTVKVYIDGSEVLSSAATFGKPTNSNITRIGLSSSVEGYYDGRISNFRICKGHAVYTGNFTVPTTELTVHPETVLLCCQSATDPEAEASGNTTVSLAGSDTTATSSGPGLTVDASGATSATTTIAIDGTATFGGNVTAAAAPTAAEHLTNKAYVDAKAQTNADAIAAVVGGAPELLNTLDELAQALSDDENFATTVTNQIAAETTARTNADTVLTNNLATETAARIAADNTKLALAGGVMTGDINMGEGAASNPTLNIASTASGGTITGMEAVYGSATGWMNVTADAAKEVVSGGKFYYEVVLHNSTWERGWIGVTGTQSDSEMAFGSSGYETAHSADYVNLTHGKYTQDGTLYNGSATTNNNVAVDKGDVLGVLIDFDGTPTISYTVNGVDAGTQTITTPRGTHYRPLATILRSNLTFRFVADDLEYLPAGYEAWMSGTPAATIAVDGTATFGGNVTAATAPTAAGHLANKAYIDAIDSANSADIAANTAAIAAEEAARIAADNTKLALAGGTMTGAIELGQVGTPLIQTQNFSADLTGGFDQPASNAFDGAVNVDGAPLARTTGNAVVVTLPINPAITVTESVIIYGETNYAPGLMNVSVTVDGVKTEANGVGNIHTFNVSGSLTEITVQQHDSGGRTYVDGFAVDGVLLADPGVTAPGGSAGPASTIAVDGTATFTDKVTVGSLEIDGALTDVNDATGNNGYILKSVGTGVEWIDILSILPQSRTTGNFTATAGQTVFTFTYNVGYLDVFVNGVKLSTDRGEFNADNGTTVTLTEALFAGDHVEMISFNTQGVGAGSVNSTADLTDVTLSGTTQNDILTYDGSKFVNGQTLNLSGAVTAQSFSGVGLELTGLNASELSTGTVSAARLGSGTADGTTFLRGDNTWAVVDSTTLKDSNNITRVAATTSGATVTGDLDLGTGTLNAGDVVLTGNLIVNGTTTTLNTAELAVEDSNITVAKNATSGAEADGAGLTVAGANATLTYAAAGDRFAFNKSVAASTFIGELLGNVTGNANTATALATARTIGGVSFDGSANIDLPGVNTTGNQNTSGNAATATALQTARTIGGVSFDGSANINLPGVNTAGNQDTSGNAATATSASKVSLTNGSGTFYPALVPGGTGAKDVVSNTGLAFNTESGLLTVSGRVAAQDFNATSDITLKDNVSIIDNALEMINNLDGISWNWKNTGKASLGVSAQNVETVAPELVGQGEHKSVNYNGLVGVLIEAVKTLSAEVEMLKATKSDRRIRKSA